MIISSKHPLQARIQRGSSCSYITAMECRVITGMPFQRKYDLHRITVFMSRSALALYLIQINDFFYKISRLVVVEMKLIHVSSHCFLYSTSHSLQRNLFVRYISLYWMDTCNRSRKRSDRWLRQSQLVHCKYLLLYSWLYLHVRIFLYI